MGRLAEVNQSTGIAVKLFDGATNQFPRARVYNAAGTEQTAAPFSSPIALTHRAVGYYSASVTPDTEGEYFVVIQVYSDAGFTTLNKKYEEVMYALSVRSIDQDLATLLSRLTSIRAANLDNLDATVSSRESEVNAASRASTNQTEHDATQSAIAAVQADTDDIQSKIGSPAGASVSADIAAIKADTVALLDDNTLDSIVPKQVTIPDAGSVTYKFRAALFNGQGNHADPDSNQLFVRVEKFDGTVVLATTLMTRVAAGRYEFSYIVSNSFTSGQHLVFFEYAFAGNSRQYIDTINHDLTDLTEVAMTVDAIKAKTDQLTFSGGRVDSVISTAQEDTIVDKVWDEALGAHNLANTMGANVNLIDDHVGETDAIQTSLNDLHSKVGTPVTTVSGDIAAVKAQTNAIETDTQDIQSKIGIPVTTLAGDVANVHAKTNLLQFTSGNVHADVKVIVAAEKQDITNRIWDEPRGSHVVAGSFGEGSQGVLSITRATNLDNLDATVSSRATQSSVSAIQNNTRFVGIVPEILKLPDTGSKDYKFYARLFDTGGSPEDPDTNTLNIEIKTVGGVTVVAQQAMTRTGVGLYEFIYTVNSSDTEQPLVVFFRYDESAVAFEHVRTTEVQEFETKLDTLLSRLTSQRATNLDNLDATISSRASSAALALVQADTDDIQAKIGAPVTTLAGDVAAVKGDTAAIKLKTDQLAFTGGRVDSVLSSAQEDTIVDKVWDETLVSHTTAGSMGFAQNQIDDILADTNSLDSVKITSGRASNLDNLDAAVSSRESEASAASRAATNQGEHDATQAAIAALSIPSVGAIADAVWDEPLAGHVAAGSAGANQNLIDDIQSDIAALNDLAIADVQTALTNQGYTTVRSSLLDNLDASISSRASQASITALQSDATAIKAKTDQLVFASGRVNSVISSTQEDAIVDKVWDELLSGHNLAGSTGERLSAAGGAFTPADVAAAVWNAPRVTYQGGGSFGEANQGVVSTTRANNLDNLNALVSSRATQSSVDTLTTRVGVPSTTLANELDLVRTDVSGLRTDYTTTRAGKLDALDVPVSSRASQASVDAIQNNTRFVGIVPSTLVLPAAGSKDYKFNANLFDEIGNPEDPDTNTINVRIETVGGVVVVATTPMNRLGVGKYEYTYTVNASDTERALRVFFEYSENSVAFQQVRVTEVQEFESKLDLLVSRLTAQRAANLDNLDATVSSRESDANAGSRFAQVAKDLTVAKEATVAAIKAKTDQFSFDTGRVVAKAEVVSDKTGYSLSSGAEDSLVDKVWDEALAGHATAGTAGKYLQDAGGAASPASIADAVWDEARAGHLAAGSFGEALQGVLSTARAANLDNLDATISSVSDKVDASDIAAAVWNAARATYTAGGSFGESNQGQLSAARAALLDNLSRLDVVVSTRAAQTTVDTINGNTDELESRLTATRAAKLDLLDAAISSRASQASVSSLPSAAQIADAVWDENLADHLTAGSTGKALDDADAVANPAAIADAVWDEVRAGHATPGTFGETLDAAISTRATQTSVNDIKGAGFNASTDTLEKIRDKIDTLPTSAGDATAANQATILAQIATRSSQGSVNTLQTSVNAIPTNPLLTTDVRLNNLDASVSSRAQEATLTQIKGAGFNATTDSLEAIRDAVQASVDFAPVLSELAAIKGAGFNSATDSLKVISDQVDAAVIGANSAASNALDAKNAALGAATSAQAAQIIADLAAIPVNPLLTTDPRLNNLDALISSRLAASAFNQILGGTFNPATDNLEAIKDAVSAIQPGNATLANQTAILAAISTLASQASVNAVQSAVNAIPVNPLLDNDPRLARLDVAVSTRASDNDMQLVKGTGFTSVANSLKAIADALATASLDLSPVITELAAIKGAGWSGVNDNLKAINDIAKVERSQIKADTASLLSQGEGF